MGAAGVDTRGAQEGRLCRIGQSIDVDPARVAERATLLTAQNQNLAIVTDLDIAHRRDPRYGHRAHQGRGARGVEVPDLQHVALLSAEAPGSGVRVIPVHPEVRAIALGNVVATA